MHRTTTLLTAPGRARVVGATSYQGDVVVAGRGGLAPGLAERGLKDEAVKQLEIVRRTAVPDSRAVADAAQQLGNLITAKEPLRAAECWGIG